uniref:Secreted protein n=1 Tax=Rhizophora mucronata TaxID=61149 RepID=A0A2P2JUL8_RHIMU
MHVCNLNFQILLVFSLLAGCKINPIQSSNQECYHCICWTLFLSQTQLALVAHILLPHHKVRGRDCSQLWGQPFFGMQN